MAQFFETMMGQKFFSSQLPELINNLGRIADALEKPAPKTFQLSKSDTIRAMSDEELARFLINFKNTFGEEYEGEMSCLEWLKESPDQVRTIPGSIVY